MLKFPQKKEEFGYSKVEAIAVILIVIVFAIVSIICYYFILNSHKAEEILNKANQRAMVVASQIQNDEKITISGFSDNKNIFLGADKLNKNQLKILIKIQEEKTCEYLKNLVITHDLVQGVNDDCTELYYNINLTGTKGPVCLAGNYVEKGKCFPCAMGATDCGCLGDEPYADGKGGCGHYVENFSDTTLTNRLPDVCCSGDQIAINGHCIKETELY